MTVDEAMALASQDCPLPHRAGEALRVLRAEVQKHQLMLDGYRELVLGYAVIVGDLTKGLDPQDPIYVEIMRVGTAWVRLDPECIKPGRTPILVGMDRADGVDTTVYAQHTASGTVLFVHEEQHPAPEPVPGCGCATCRPITMSDMRMVLCPDCGNKRCPRATNHRNACSGSNEPGQPGSSYENAPPILPIEKRIGTNVGHGHVWPRPDGMKVRCGGPGICPQCSRDESLAGTRGNT